MREVEEALARAFAQRSPAEASAEVPPPPHLRTRTPKNKLQTRPDTFESKDTQALESFAPSPAADLIWPPLVLTLERQWGDRFERLADALIDAKDQRNLRVFLFTSCHRAEGRTTLVLALTKALARRPIRTLLIDADLSGPMLARTFGLRPLVGFDDVVESGQALADAVIDAHGDHLSILPLRAAVAHPKEFLASAAWTCSMARLRREFDLILLDGSPMFTGLSASVLHSSVDAAILVHNRSMTGERAILRAGEVLEAGGIPLLGLAETFV